MILLSGQSFRALRASLSAASADCAPRMTSLGSPERVDAPLISAMDPISQTTRYEFFVISDLSASRTSKRDSTTIVASLDPMTPTTVPLPQKGKRRSHTTLGSPGLSYFGTHASTSRS